MIQNVASFLTHAMCKCTTSVIAGTETLYANESLAHSLLTNFRSELQNAKIYCFQRGTRSPKFSGI